MTKNISPEELKKYKSLKGKVRGATLKAYGDFILQEKGKEGLKVLEEKMAEAGFSTKFKDIKSMDFYPVAMQAVILEIIDKLFQYDKKKYQEMGRSSAKFSLIIKMFMKYFFSEEQMIKKSPQIWEKSYTIGKFKLIEYNEEENRVILRIEGFKLHPVHGQILIGYFASILQMIGGHVATGKETKSPFRGDQYYEFLMEWNE